MSIFDSINKSSEGATDLGKKYINTSFDYYKLKTFHSVSSTISLLIKLVTIGILCVLGVIFIAIFGAISIGNYLQDASLGYLCVGLIFMVIGFIIYLFKGKIDKSVIVSMSKKFFTKP